MGACIVRCCSYDGTDCRQCATGFTADGPACFAKHADVVLTFTASAPLSSSSFRADLAGDIATALGVAADRVSVLSTDTTQRTATVRIRSSAASGAAPVADVVQELKEQATDSTSALLTSSSVAQHVDTSVQPQASYFSPPPPNRRNVAIDSMMDVAWVITGQDIAFTVTLNRVAW